MRAAVCKRLKREDFTGEIDGGPVDLYTLKDTGMEVRVCNWGARIMQILVPDRSGVLGDVVRGYGSLEEARSGCPEMGALVGRCANRIAGASFELDGRVVHLDANDGPNHLHGGWGGAMRALFTAVQPDAATLDLAHTFKDGTDGYPGNCTLRVRYALEEGGALKITFDAVTDAPTIVNFSSHAYFNLEGAGASDILDHRLEVFADAYTPVDACLIPTGEIAPVAGTPFDFTRPRRIGERIGAVDTQLCRGKGYDHNFVLRPAPCGERLAARLLDPVSGRSLEVSTTEPGMQLYTGNFLRPEYRGKGCPLSYRSALCLETQHFPDAVHHPHFPSVVLRPGERFISRTTYRFGVEALPL